MDDRFSGFKFYMEDDSDVWVLVNLANVTMIRFIANDNLEMFFVDGTSKVFKGKVKKAGENGEVD